MLSTITLTFGDCAENHVGMQIIGEKCSKGYTYENLIKISELFPGKCELYNLNNGTQLPNAYLLIVRNPFPDISTQLFSKLTRDETMGGVNWDTKAFMYGRVVNKLKRYNLTFSDLGKDMKKINPDYENKKGTIYNYKMIPELNELYNRINNLPNSQNLVIEGNYYYDINKTSIGFHGDTERKKVIGFRMGRTFPLHFQWYYNHQPITTIMTFNLNHGDLYVMSEKTVGSDWRKSSEITLRHAAGYKI